MNEPTSIKVVLLGESGVGKTSIINQFISKKFNPKMSTSVSAQFTSKIMEFPEQKRTLRFDIWDTVGQEKYRSLTKIFYKDAAVAILVYDITRKESYEELKNYWYNQLKECSPSNIVIGIAANKCDLYDNEQVSEDEARKFADEIGAVFKLTSANTNTGIEDLFKTIGCKVLDPNYSEDDESNQKKMNIKIDNDKTKKKKKGCC